MSCALGIKQDCSECRMCGNGKGGKDMEHDGCKGCRYERETGDSIHCQGCKQNAIDKYVKMTNADRIINMTNEELAEFLSSDDFGPCKNCDYLFKDAMNESCNAPSDFVCTKTYAAALIQKWLKSECDVEC